MLADIIARPLAVALLSSLAFSSTWIVDDDGGAGVDFTSIDQALLFAGPGDLVRVRPGTYGAFTLNVGATVLGEPGVTVDAVVTVRDVPAGARAVLSNLVVDRLEVRDCSAAVIVDRVFAFASNAAVVVRGSTDVRLRRIHLVGQLDVASSRVELTDSLVFGRAGQDQIGDCCGGGDGQTAVLVAGGGVLHASRSSIRGGNGGQAKTWANFFGGDGAPAVWLTAGDANVLVTGVETNVVQGGAQGLGSACTYDGDDASAVVLSPGSARVSGVALLGRLGYCGEVTPAVVNTGGTFEAPNPVDPSLSLPVDTIRGTQVTFSVNAAPGASVRLRLGRQPAVIDLPDVLEDRLTIPLRTFDLGTVPPSGVVTFPFTLPIGLPEGFMIVAQASAIDSSGTRLTQSVPIVLR